MGHADGKQWLSVERQPVNPVNFSCRRRDVNFAVAGVCRTLLEICGIIDCRIHRNKMAGDVESTNERVRVINDDQEVAHQSDCRVAIVVVDRLSCSTGS